MKFWNILFIVAFFFIALFSPIGVQAQTCPGAEYCAVDQCGWSTECTCEPLNCTIQSVTDCDICGSDQYGCKTCDQNICTGGVIPIDCRQEQCWSGTSCGSGGGGGAGCGDAVCNNGETCDTCPGDCGVCPVISSTVRARGVVIPSGTTACATVNSSTTFISDTFVLSNTNGTPQTVSGGTFASWTQPAGTYTLTDTPPGDYVLRLACWTTDTPAAQGTGLTADVVVDATLTWNLGYTDGAGWWQVDGGGDAYASAALRSYIPSLATPRHAELDGDGGTPGVVLYGTTYDFSSSSLDTGNSYISSEGWIADETYASTDYYAVMYHRFGSPAATSTGDTAFTSEPASQEDPYVVDGNLTINTADWNVTSGENIVVLVDGNLIINRSINLSGTGFVSFIVNGNISVDSAVGVAYSSSAPVLEGIYITSPTGTFFSGTSANVGTERFVGEGIFIAGTFSLERDLDSVGQNNTTSSELFIYNPQLLVTMPDEMRDVPVSWQEVAP